MKFEDKLNVLDTDIAVQGEWLGLDNGEWDFSLKLSSEHGSSQLSSDELAGEHSFFRQALIKCLPEGESNQYWINDPFVGWLEYHKIIKLIINNKPSIPNFNLAMV